MKHTKLCGHNFCPGCHTRKLWTHAKREITNEIYANFETLMWRSTQKRIHAGLFIAIMFRECRESEGDAALKHLNSESNLLLYSASLSSKAIFFPHVTGSHLLCSGLSQRSTSFSWVMSVKTTIKMIKMKKKSDTIVSSKCNSTQKRCFTYVRMGGEMTLIPW